MNRNLTKKQKRKEAQKQLREMLRLSQESLFKKLDQVLASGALAEDEYLQEGNYLLSKAVMDSFMRERPFSALAPTTKKEFDNIHLCC